MSGSRTAAQRQGPFLAVFAGVLAGIVAVALHHFRAGCLLVGLSVLMGAMFRLVLRDPGMLEVRSRTFDVAFMGVLGIAITSLTLVIPTP